MLSFSLTNLFKNRQTSSYKVFKHPALFARQCLRRSNPAEGSIGVAIASRNHGCYLKKAVESCIYQTRPPRQIVIVDDASEDNSVEVGESLADQYSEVHMLKNSRQLGVPLTRNKGISACNTDYVMIFDSDDLLDSRYFEEVAVILDSDPDVAVACSSYQEFGDRKRGITLPPFDRIALLTDCILMGCSLARRSVLEVLGGFDTEQIFEDWELWVRIAGAGWSGKSIPKHYYLYRIHGKGKDVTANLDRRRGEDLIYQKHRTLYDQSGITRENGKWTGGKFYPPYR